jgi:hypothetical protein
LIQTSDKVTVSAPYVTSSLLRLYSLDKNCAYVCNVWKPLESFGEKSADELQDPIMQLRKAKQVQRTATRKVENC